MLPFAMGQHLGGVEGVYVSGNCHALPWQLPQVTALGCGSPPVPGTLALLLYPSQQWCGHVSLALVCILLMMGTVGHLLVGAPAVPVSSSVRNLSQTHAFILLGTALLRVHVLWTCLLRWRVSQSRAHLLILLSDLEERELVTLMRLDVYVCSFLYFLPHLLVCGASPVAQWIPAGQESQET